MIKTALAAAFLMAAPSPVQYRDYQRVPPRPPYPDYNGGPLMPVPRPPPEREYRGDMPVPYRLPPSRAYDEYRRFRDCAPRAPRC